MKRSDCLDEAQVSSEFELLRKEVISGRMSVVATDSRYCLRCTVNLVTYLWYQTLSNLGSLFILHNFPIV